jgi:hypothetical protein
MDKEGVSSGPEAKPPTVDCEGGAMNSDRSLIAMLGAGLAVLALMAVAWFSYQATYSVQRSADADERSATALERSADADERSVAASEQIADTAEEQTCWTQVLSMAINGAAITDVMGYQFSSSATFAEQNEWIMDWLNRMNELALLCDSLP